MAISASTLLAVNLKAEDFVVCPYQHIDGPISKIKAANCKNTTITEINPQNTEIWVFATLIVTRDMLSGDKPLALFISAKASTHTYLNGQFLASNGKPGANVALETPGVMDTTMYVPREKLTLGVNDIALHMSSHHGWIALGTPVHRVHLGEYVNPTTHKLSYYWPSLLPFGALIIGAFYMGLLALVKRDHWSVTLLPIMSLVGAAQLYTEVYRGLTAYAYPVHDLRLILILICSMIFGLCLAAHVIWSLNLKNKQRLFVLTSALTLGAVLALTGFDLMSAFALFVPAFISLILALYQLRHGEPRALAFSVILGVFLLCVILAPSAFLDVTFFYTIAALLFILFINEVRAYAKERKQRIEEQGRANKLQTILEQNERRDKTESINVESAGKIEVVNIANIVYCKGAGDYAELVLDDGSSLLHSKRLVDLEKTLPSVFLRVHRSYIVNSSLIKSLKRKPSGVGELAMVDKSTVPVSRRIMPNIRILL